MKLNVITRDFAAAVFDFDGTVVDSMGMWTDIDIEYLGRHNILFRPEIQRDIEGMSVEETAVYFRDVLGVRRSIEEMRADWIEMSLYNYAHRVKVKPHARELLKLLKENGAKIGIATSNAIENVRACLDANSLNEYFDTVVTASDVERGKPYPDIYLRAAELLSVSPSECVVFEDIPAGIMAGKAAGMETVAVFDEYSRPLTDEKKLKADHYIEDFGELI